MPFVFVSEKNSLTIKFEGDFLHFNDTGLFQTLKHKIHSPEIKSIKIDCTRLECWDSTLLSLLFFIEQTSHKYSVKTILVNAPTNLSKLNDLALQPPRKIKHSSSHHVHFLERIGIQYLSYYNSFSRSLFFLGQIFSSLLRLIKHQAIFRKIDLMLSLENCSYKAIGIVALVSFMVGLILAFVGAIQLKTFGAQIYVASLVTIGMVRIMGAIMMGIIMAGRTGASYAATIGTMQVNEEIDALKTMGIPIIDFLVLPRTISLIIAMPFLTILADFTGVLGGAVVGVFALGISPAEYWQYTKDAFSTTDFLVGLFHSLVYAFIIAACGCYYGITCGKDAGSVGLATTKSVVSAIVWMIVATGILTVLFEMMGI